MSPLPENVDMKQHATINKQLKHVSKSDMKAIFSEMEWFIQKQITPQHVNSQTWYGVICV